MRGVALRLADHIRLAAVPDGLSRGRSSHRRCERRERSVAQSRVAIDTARVVVDRAVAVNGFVASVQLVAEDHELYLGAIALPERESLTVDCCHVVRVRPRRRPRSPPDAITRPTADPVNR